MSKASCDIRIGTSGWHYDHWANLFYPEKLAKRKWLEYYTQHFNTVEINNTFYQLPKPQTFENWHKQAPNDFLFTVKANRYITHIKRLQDVAEPLERFFEGARLLEKNLGPVLYQLPPSMHKDLERLASFIKLLPKKQTAVFEFRHESWFSEDVYGLLDKFNVGFCVHDLYGKGSPKIVMGDVVYVRFHGTTGRYSGNYSKAQLKSWAEWLKQYIKQVRSIYVYFNNDVGGHAINNAKMLRKEMNV
jgi:uncharacterized protein YecE (DUF72 family)